ncbi:MAG: nucleotidyltransferase family protein [Anaerolineales bacterium]|nr:nucleotidyltransferase family protein [Anaerolineales bacterium]
MMTTNNQLPVLITAGGIPEPDSPLYHETLGQPKALLDMGGMTMLGRVLHGLAEAESVGELVVTGLDEVYWAAIQHEQPRPVTFLPNAGSMVGNIQQGLAYLRPRHETTCPVALICSSDIPHMQGFMVDELVNEARPFDRLFYYVAVTPETIEAVYPGAERTYVNLKGGLRLAGADVGLVRYELLDTDPQLWEQLTAARKHAWQIARRVGWGVLFKLLLRQLSVADIYATAVRVLKTNREPQLIITPHAALAMDADKPHQVALLRAKTGWAGEV